jgi:hypothetical protein
MAIYYGGDAFTGAYAEAEASTLINQSTQIDAAFDLYYVDNGRFPGNPDGTGAMQELVDSEYLGSIPEAPRSRISNRDWQIDYSRGIARSLIGSENDAEAAEVCTRAREQMDLTGPVLFCDDPTIRKIDPCCIMPSSEL